MAQHHCPDILHQAQEISKKFTKAFQLFRNCHAIYDGKTVTDDDIIQLGKQNWCWFSRHTKWYIYSAFIDRHIKDFMAYYRSTFCHATILPKMHMLETHVIRWLEKWCVGFGIMGEQGAESIHKYFNSLERTYHGIPDPANRLHNIMKEHLRHTAPSMVALQPPPKKLRREEPTREE